MSHEVNRSIVTPAQTAVVSDFEITVVSGFDVTFRSLSNSFPAFILDDQLFISGPGATKSTCGAWRITGAPTAGLVTCKRIDKSHGIPVVSETISQVRIGYNGNLILRDGANVADGQTLIDDSDIDVLALRTRYPAGTSDGSSE